MKKDFADLLVCDGIIERTTEMQAKFIGAIESNHHSNSNQAASFLVEAGACPDFAPGVARD
jgi:hypothetical protein